GEVAVARPAADVNGADEDGRARTAAEVPRPPRGAVDLAARAGGLSDCVGRGLLRRVSASRGEQDERDGEERRAASAHRATRALVHKGTNGYGRRTALRGPAKKPSSRRSGIASVSPTGSPSKRSTASRFAPPPRTCSTSAASAGRSHSSSGSRSGTSERPPRSTKSAAPPPRRTTCAPATRA